jgi:hypothetical protein
MQEEEVEVLVELEELVVEEQEHLVDHLVQEHQEQLILEVEVEVEQEHLQHQQVEQAVQE